MVFLPSANHILCGVRLSSGVCDAAVTSAATRVVLGVELLLMLRWYDIPPVCRPAFEGSRTPRGEFQLSRSRYDRQPRHACYRRFIIRVSVGIQIQGIKKGRQL